MNSSARITIYTDDHSQGGVAIYTHSMTCGLAQRGYNVSCIQSEKPNRLTARQAELGVKHIWLSYDSRFNPDRNADDTTEVNRVLDLARPDVILFANCSAFSHFAAKQVAHQRGIPYVIVEGFAAPIPKHTPDVYWKLHRAEEQYLRAKAVVVVSQENLDLLRSQYRLGPTKGEVIHYGRPAEYFAPRRLDVRQRLRKELDLPQDAVVSLTVGRLETVKGYQHQLPALAQLKQKKIWPNLYSVWLGEGSVRVPLQNVLNETGVADHVRMPGWRWDIADWLDACDLFLLTSHHEGMPLAIMEAMAKGLPVLATAVSGIPEELGNTGVLLPDPNHVPQQTVAAIVDSIERFAADPGAREAVGQGCRERASALFREDRMVDQTLQVIKRAQLPVGDYVSRGLQIVRPDACFPNMVVGDRKLCNWQYLRREIPHNWYVDRRSPSIGFTNRDEAHILYNSALRCQGKSALEIGCWLGWSACHLALGGVRLQVVDPILANADFLASVRASLEAAGVFDRVQLIPGGSPGAVQELTRQLTEPWTLLFIDGNHDGPAPLQDAQLCAEFAAPDALILFHDLAAPDVAQGLAYLRQRGWNTMIYLTMQIMGVAWRGSLTPVQHFPDPEIRWTLPDFLQGYRISGIA